MPAVLETAGRRVASHRMPAAFQPAAALDPMTGQRRRWRPALARCRRAAKSRQVVIAMAGRPEPVTRRRDSVRPGGPKFCKSGYCESFEHRSPPFPRLARLAGERDGQPGATIALTRPKPARSILNFC